MEENRNVTRIDRRKEFMLQKMRDSFKHMRKKTDNLDAKVELLDTQSRRNKPSFLFGIPLVFGETWDLCDAKMREIICRDMKCQPVHIDRAQRVGSAILVRFQFFKQREEVLIEPQQRAESPCGSTCRWTFQKESGYRRAKLQRDKLVQ